MAVHLAGRRWTRDQAVALVIEAVVVVLVVLLMVRLVPAWLTDATGLDPVERDEARGRVRTGLLALLAGAIAAIGAIYTARTYSLNRRTADERHALDQAGQITERFTRAVDQLGHEAEAVRIGGIYALGHIARDSSRDRATIVDVLSAYVRLHATEPHGPVKQDVQAAVLVLGLHPHDEAPGAISAVLMGVNLREARLRDVHLEGARLRGAILEGAILERAWLTGADLNGARLHDAKLRDVHLEGAKLAHAYIHRVDLGGAHMEDANLWGAELVDTDLCGACLSRVAFRDDVDLQTVTWDQFTVWPEHFEPQAHGARPPLTSELT